MVGKRMEDQGIFLDLWPQVLSFCGRGWFDAEEEEEEEEEDNSMDVDVADEGLSLPTF